MFGPWSDIVPTNTLHELADGVFVWIQPGGESGVSNAGAIVDDDGITVVDSLMVRSQWEPFAAAVEKLGRPVRRLVLTHAHIDHVGGSRAFANAMVLGSQQTSDLLDGEMPLVAYKAFMPAFDAEFDELAEIGTRPVTHLVTDAAQLTPRVELLPANGHTDGDVMVLVADVDVLFAGDLCFFGVTPLAFQGNPERRGPTCSTVVGELADTIVPGHGPVGGEAEVEAPAAVPAALRGDRTRRRDRDPARTVGHLARARPPRRDQHRAGGAPRAGPRRDAQLHAPRDGLLTRPRRGLARSRRVRSERDPSACVRAGIR